MSQKNRLHKNLDLEAVSALVAQVPDPEIPVLTITDLGILQQVYLDEQGCYQIDITPTYSGCPAMHAIEQSIGQTLSNAGVDNAQINLVLTPAWTSDWMTEGGRQKLKAYGIAPPQTKCGDQLQQAPLVFAKPDNNSLSVPLFVSTKVQCPRCDSMYTRCVSTFGSTACKEHWLCKDCKEPFDHFKCH